MAANRHVKSFLLYNVVGWSGTIVDWGLFFVLNKIFEMKYMSATVVSVVCAIFVNWFMGRLIVFRNEVRHSVFSDLLRIYAVSVGGILLNMLMMKLQVDVFRWNSMIAKVFSSGTVFFYNYTLRRYVIYRFAKKTDFHHSIISENPEN